MKDYIKVLLILLIPLLIICIYSISGTTYSFSVERIDMGSMRPTTETAENDSLQAKALAQPDTMALDTTKQRILLFGDSMVEGLAPRMTEYATANGHEITTICWYSSATRHWATDTLRHYMREVKPTYVLMTIGGNEQYSRDLKACEENIRTILKIIDDVPYVWICTPAWKLDAEFNSIPERLAGKGHFYDSRKLTFKRGSDHHHPTKASASQWADSIASWLQSDAPSHPIVMNTPPEGTKGKGNRIVLSSPRSSRE